MSESGAIHCRYAGRCAGCPEILVPYNEQIQQKKMYLESLLERSISVRVHSVGQGHLRDRCDLSFQRKDGRTTLGLYDLERKNLLDLEECPQMTLSLWAAVEKLRRDLPPIDLGSIRVRVSPSGKIGLWLDFPNVSVKALLEERAWFERLLKWAYVEIGQKRKRLIFVDGKHQLLEDEFETWFETYVGKEFKAFPIYGKVGGFTQPGFKANKKLMEVISSFLPEDSQNILELCSGSGNFSFFMASLGHRVTAVEVDDFSIAAMKESLKKFSRKDLIDIHKVNLHSKNPKVADLFKEQDIVLADPPRSGLGASLDMLASLSVLPKKFIYVSCYPESFLADTIKLENLGFVLRKVEAVDQFPQSKHIEIIAYLERL